MVQEASTCASKTRMHVDTRDSRMLRAWPMRSCFCLCMCLSVTLCDCIKTVQARITKFSPWDARKTLVNRDNFCAFGRGDFPQTKSSKKSTPSKKTLFCRCWLV